MRVVLLCFFVLLTCSLAHAGDQSNNFHPIFGDNSITPSATDKFDDLVLSTCGEWGNKVTRNDLYEMITSPDAATFVDSLYHRLDKKVIGSTTLSKQAFVKSLIGMLYNGGVFQYAFCGSLHRKNGDVGMHYFARMQQMQEQGWGGLDKECKAYDNNLVHNLGITYKSNTLETLGRKCPTSFVSDMHAEDMIVAMAMGYRDALENGRESCFHIAEVGAQGVYFKLTLKDAKLLSFYAVPYPHCPGPVCKMCDAVQ